MTINVNAGSYGEHDYQPRNEFPDKPKPNCANLGSGAKDDPEHCNHLDYVCSFKRWPWSKKKCYKKGTGEPPPGSSYEDMGIQEIGGKKLKTPKSKKLKSRKVKSRKLKSRKLKSRKPKSRRSKTRKH